MTCIFFTYILVMEENIMITKCIKCDSKPNISDEDAKKLRMSSNNNETVKIVCPNCGHTWSAVIKTDHGISNQMSEEDFSDKM